MFPPVTVDIFCVTGWPLDGRPAPPALHLRSVRRPARLRRGPAVHRVVDAPVVRPVATGAAIQITHWRHVAAPRRPDPRPEQVLREQARPGEPGPHGSGRHCPFSPGAKRCRQDHRRRDPPRSAPSWRRHRLRPGGGPRARLAHLARPHRRRLPDLRGLQGPHCHRGRQPHRPFFRSARRHRRDHRSRGTLRRRPHPRLAPVRRTSPPPRCRPGHHRPPRAAVPR